MKELTEAEIQRIKESGKRLTKAIMDFKKNPDNYKTPKYITPSGDKIAVLDEEFFEDGRGLVSGVIVDSPTKIFIGFTNTFHYPNEVTEL